MILAVEHSPDWAMNFEQEASRISVALGNVVVQVHHIGSTSICHTKAKPVIDMLLEVDSLESLDQKSPSLEALGYEAKGEFGIPGRRYFRLDDAAGRRTHPSIAVEYGEASCVTLDPIQSWPDIRTTMSDQSELSRRLPAPPLTCSAHKR